MSTKKTSLYSYDLESLKYLEARDPEGHNNDGDYDNSNDRGHAEDTFVRVTPNSYSDGQGAPETGLPAPRDISNQIYAQDGNLENGAGINEFFQFFGQYLTHDIAEAATGNSGPNNTPEIILPPGQGLPFPITRTPYETEGGVRQQINEETSFLDLSGVYGNNHERLELARAGNSYTGESAYLLLGEGGMLPTIKEVGIDSGKTSLEVLEIFRPDGFAGLPNPAGSDNQPGTGDDPAAATFESRFYAGDNRVNQQPSLLSQQTMWARNHNWHVEQLKYKYPDWSEDQLFEAARAMNEAEWQHVVYDEYLTKLVGEWAVSEYTGYKSDVDPSIINEFTTVAFRFGHDQSRQILQTLAESGVVTGEFTLGQAFLALGNGSAVTIDSDGLDGWIRGQLSALTQEIDGKVVDGNRNTLFGIGANGGPIVADLTVFDTTRGRDHGVNDYNTMRQGLGLYVYSSFDEYGEANEIDAETLTILKSLYGNDITKLDAIVGGLLEKHVYGSQLGELFTLLTVMQFEAIRDGDRLYYENRFADHPEIIEAIKATSLADIIARTSGVEHVYHDAFAAHSRIGGTEYGEDVYGTEGVDLLMGYDGEDGLYGYGGNDDVYAGKDADKVWSGDGDDMVWGEDGNDYADAGNGNDHVDGGWGNDWLYGGWGHDRIYAGEGDDYARGGDGSDALYGDEGYDRLYGDKGGDHLGGGGGYDLLWGGKGRDTFHFGEGSDRDVIKDFDPRFDKINLHGLDLDDATIRVVGNRTIFDFGDTDADGYNDVLVVHGLKYKPAMEHKLFIQDDIA
jgi:Ca2+-binding RTX toxin-like protein